MATKTVRAPNFPIGTAVEAFPLQACDVERREGRIPNIDPVANGYIDASHQVELTGEAGQYVLFAVTNEAQSVKVDATAKKFKLKYSGQTTADIKFNATAAEVREALEALSNIAVGDVGVTGGPGNSGGTTPYVVIFQGALGGADAALLEFVQGSEGALTGGGATVTITTTRAGSKGPTGSALTCIFTID